MAKYYYRTFPQLFLPADALAPLAGCPDAATGAFIISDFMHTNLCTGHRSFWQTREQYFSDLHLPTRSSSDVYTASTFAHTHENKINDYLLMNIQRSINESRAVQGEVKPHSHLLQQLSATPPHSAHTNADAACNKKKCAAEAAVGYEAYKQKLRKLVVALTARVRTCQCCIIFRGCKCSCDITVCC